MSERNYQLLRRQGIINKFSPVCFVASIDRISPHKDISAKTYTDYARDIEVQPTLPKRRHNPFAAKIFNRVAKDLGLASWQEMEFDRVRTATKLTQLLRRARSHGLMVVADISCVFDEYGRPNDKDTVHAVGVLHSSSSKDFKLKSTWVPKQLSGVITAETLINFMSQPKERPSTHFPFNDANVTLIPVSSTDAIQA